MKGKKSISLTKVVYEHGKTKMIYNADPAKEQWV